MSITPPHSFWQDSRVGGGCGPDLIEHSLTIVGRALCCCGCDSERQWESVQGVFKNRTSKVDTEIVEWDYLLHRRTSLWFYHIQDSAIQNALPKSADDLSILRLLEAANENSPYLINVGVIKVFLVFRRPSRSDQNFVAPHNCEIRQLHAIYTEYSNRNRKIGSEASRTDQTRSSFTKSQTQGDQVLSERIRHRETKGIVLANGS